MSPSDGDKPIGLGLLGLGVVGTGVAQTLADRGDALAQRVGRPMQLRRVLVRDPLRPRSIVLPAGILTNEVERVLGDPGITIVIEALGGEYPAVDFIRKALAANKDVVTANKEVMAKHGPELRAWAARHGRALRYEASVGGGVPIVAALREDLAANRITSIRAIINGTTNYILTEMAAGGLSFASALQQAQALGYAEPDPDDDIEGVDAAYKLAILASLAFQTTVRPEDIHREGISRLAPQDFRYARELGYTIKLLAIAKEEGAAVQARVHPALVPRQSLLAQVSGVYNAVQIEGDLAGQLVLYGRGAGAEPTSSAVMADVIHLARDRALGIPNRPEPPPNGERPLMPFDDLKTRHYFRMAVADRPGVLAQIARLFGEHEISIASFIQQETDEDAQIAEIVIMTHAAQERAVQTALSFIGQLAAVRDVGAVVRVER
ncbi:MAG TPA: homoserine dehydrogenase [Dehalococcoidia bacterium]|nr:homoserine dehydrogenase [Dehalococcoidia bacterium]